MLFSLERNSLVAGILLSAIQMMMLADLLEKTDSVNSVLSVFLVKVIVRLRPLMVGLIYKLIFQIINQIVEKKNPHEKTESLTEIKTQSAGAGKNLDFSLLYRREIEVARLAAKGYTNAQIAEELYMSTETVKRHMSTIFEKLGIESRKQLKESDN